MDSKKKKRAAVEVKKGSSLESPNSGVRFRRKSVTSVVQNAQVSGGSAWVSPTKPPERSPRSKRKSFVGGQFLKRALTEEEAKEKEKEKELKEKEKGEKKKKKRRTGTILKKDKEVKAEPAGSDGLGERYSVEKMTKSSKGGRHKCVSCDGRIVRKTRMINFLDGKRSYHVPCFTCTNCGTTLQKDFLLSGGNPHCVKCMEKKNPKCASCKLAIRGAVTEAMGKKWHPEHFCCVQCHKPLNSQYDTQSFFVEDGKPYCADDYYELFGKRCSCGCDEVITKEMLLYQGNHYKPRHFVCKACSNDLSALDVDSIVVITQPSLTTVLFCSNRCEQGFCPAAFNKEVKGNMENVKAYVTKANRASACWWCNGAIVSGQEMFTSPDGVTCHAQHLVCEGCGHAIEKRFMWLDGQPKCTECVQKLSGAVTTYFNPKSALCKPLSRLTTCTICDKKFSSGEKALQSLGSHPFHFHLKCATCDECEQTITGDFLWKNGYPLCSSCWERSPAQQQQSRNGATTPPKVSGLSIVTTLSSPSTPTVPQTPKGIAFKRVNEEKRKSSGSSTCEWCDCVILINQLIIVSPDGMAYHLDHFNCSKCENQIKNKFIWKRDAPVCQNCASQESEKTTSETKFLSANSEAIAATGKETCDYCDESIGKKEMILFSKETNRYFHRQHFMCFACGHLVAEKFHWLEGFQHCERCGLGDQPQDQPIGLSESEEVQENTNILLTLAQASRISAKKTSCFTCDKDIKLGGSVIISPLGTSFHENCLHCNSCTKRIKTKFGWKDKMFAICESCVKVKAIQVEISSSKRSVRRAESKGRLALVLPVSQSPKKEENPRASSPLLGKADDGKNTITRIRAATLMVQQPEIVTSQSFDVDTGVGWSGSKDPGGGTPSRAHMAKFERASTLASGLSLDAESLGRGAGGIGDEKRGSTRGSFTLMRENREDYVRLLKLEDGDAAKIPEALTRRGTTRVTLGKGLSMQSLFEKPSAMAGDPVGAKVAQDRRKTVAKGVTGTGSVRRSTRAPNKEDTRLLPESRIVDEIKDVIDIQHVLGRGGFATVKQGVDLQTKEIVAVKTFNKWELKGETLIFLKREISALSQINHPNIVRLHQVIEDQHFVYMIVEFIKGENLFERLESTYTISERQTQTVVRRLLECLAFLHEKSIIHQDIKTENMMLPVTAEDPFDSAKLIDFGFARFVRSDELLEEYCGSVDYLAPEIIERRPYTLGVDIWAAGCVMYNCLTGLRPFFSPQEAAEGKIQWFDDDWDKLTPEARDLVIKLLVVDPKERFTAEQGLKHPWFHIEIQDHVDADSDDEGEEEGFEEGEEAFDSGEPFGDEFENALRESEEEQTCIGCAEAIEKGKQMVFSPLGTAYHPDCFFCEICENPIKEGFVWKKGIPFCHPCFENAVAGKIPYSKVATDAKPLDLDTPQNCLWCENVVEKGSLCLKSTNGYIFHPGCLICAECSDACEDLFIWRKGIPCCSTCFEKVYSFSSSNDSAAAPKFLTVYFEDKPTQKDMQCMWCEEEIPIGSPAVVSPEGNAFHSHCLMCDECSNVATGEFVWRDGIPCCRGCYEKIHPPSSVAEQVTILSSADENRPVSAKQQCMWCEKHIEVGEKCLVSPSATAFHAECLMCDECSEVAKEFVWREGIPCCRSCWEKTHPPASSGPQILSSESENKPVSSKQQCMWCEKYIEKGEKALVSPDGTAFHSQCLMCDECSEVAREFVWREGIPCCRGCWEKIHPPPPSSSQSSSSSPSSLPSILSAEKENKPVTSAQQCMWCENDIPTGEKALLSPDSTAFHIGCLMCDECSEVAKEFVWREGIPCCRGCWEKIHPPPPSSSSSASPSLPTTILSAATENKPVSSLCECLWCDGQIPAGEKAVLSPEGTSFHIDCLMCDECSEVAKEFVWREETPCCRTCWEKTHPSPSPPSSSSQSSSCPIILLAETENKPVTTPYECMWCDKEIATGEKAVVSPDSAAFHIDCLTCDECSEVAKEFIWREGIPCCRGCWEKIHPPSPSPSPPSSPPSILSAETENKPVTSAQQCMWCENDIPTGEKALLSPDSTAFHIGCLMCDECSEVAKEFVWREGIPCCRGCWEKINPPRSTPSSPSLSILIAEEQNMPIKSDQQCLWCEKWIQGGEKGVVSSDGTVFHIGCLMCDECSDLSVEFVWRDGIPCCRNCWEKTHPPPSPPVNIKPAKTEEDVQPPEPEKSPSELKVQATDLDETNGSLQNIHVQVEEAKEENDEEAKVEEKESSLGSIDGPKSKEEEKENAKSKHPSPPLISRDRSPVPEQRNPLIESSASYELKRPDIVPSLSFETTKEKEKEQEEEGEKKPSVKAAASLFENIVKKQSEGFVGRGGSERKVIVKSSWRKDRDKATISPPNVSKTSSLAEAKSKFSKPVSSEGRVVDKRTFTSVNLEIGPIFGRHECVGCGKLMGQGQFGISSPNKKTYHPPCFMCGGGCGKMIDDEFLWKGEVGWCKDCCEKE